MERLFGKVGLDGHVRRNRFRVAFLFIGFLLAAELIGLPIAAIASHFIDFKTALLRRPADFLAIYATIIAIAATALFLLRWWRFPIAIGARLAVQRDTPACRRLQQLVGELAALNGMAQPQVLMIASPARNAFAAGLNARNATIIVTTGLEKALSDGEMKAVLAHELAHIAFGDTRVMAASAVMVETLDAIRRFSPWKNGLGWKTGLTVLFLPVLIPIGMIFAASSVIGDTIGRGTRLIVASSRELIADAEAIRMTHDPAALVSALIKIDGRSGIGTFPRAIEAMMIDGPAEGAEATHPTIAQRIRIISELTGEYFPLPVEAAVPAASPIDLVGARKPATSGRLGHALSQTPFGRVREGQGKIVRKSLGFKIAIYAGCALLFWGYWSAMATFEKIRSEGDVSSRLAHTRSVKTETGKNRSVIPAMPPLRGSL